MKLMGNNSGEVTTLMVAMMVVVLGLGFVFARKHGMMGMYGMSHDSHAADKNKASTDNTYAKDPVCGMAVEMTAGAITSVRNNKTYYFCSKEDKEKFDSLPEKYLK